MPEPIFTVHARDMLKEREIPEQWVLDAINAPDEKSIGSDGNAHYFKSSPESENRILHVVVNEFVEPNRIVTLFLDRRRRQK
jgi:hypothetical protein